jgi:hypothetical protein
MRYADGPTVEVNRLIAAPPDEVWLLVSDINLPARLSTVVGCEPGRTFAWAVGDVESPAATWRFDLEPDGDGTQVTFAARIGPGTSGLTPAIEAMPDKEERIIERRLAEHRRNMEATLDGIAALVGGD